MIRRSLLWSLTLVLVAVITILVIRGRRMEKQQAARMAEVIQPSNSTNTRILNPQDLEILNPAIQLKSNPFASHQIEIRNNGDVAYSQILLRMTYINQRGEELTSKTFSIAQTVKPGASIKLPNLPTEAVPAMAVKLQLAIVAADVESDHGLANHPLPTEQSSPNDMP
jgi:hypothetical protein